MLEDPNVDVSFILQDQRVVEALRQCDNASADLEGILKALFRLGEWTLGAHDDAMADEGIPVLEVVCQCRPRGDLRTIVLGSGPHALAAASRCLLKTLAYIDGIAAAGFEQLIADED